MSRAPQYDPQSPYGLAEYLIRQGVPVFYEKPAYLLADQGFVFDHKYGWNDFKPEMERLDKIRDLYSRKPLRALKYGWGAVTGVQYDVIDVDVQHDGHTSYLKLKKLGVLPPSFGRYRTPSGGWHIFAPRSGLRKKKDVKGFKGIDFLMGADHEEPKKRGRAFTYIYPTIKYGKMRPSEEGGVEYKEKMYSPSLGSYVMEAPVDVPLLLEGQKDPRHARWLEWLVMEAGAVAEEPPPPEVPVPIWSGGGPSRREQAYLDKVLSNLDQEVRGAPPGASNDTFVRACKAAGNYIAGAGLDEARAYAVLMNAGRARGVHDPEPEDIWRRNVADGKLKPKQVPGHDPSCPQTPSERADDGVTASDGEEYVRDQDMYISELLDRHGLSGSPLRVGDNYDQ